MYTNNYLAEHNTATHLTEIRRDAAHARLLASLKREQRQHEIRRGGSLAGMIRQMARFVLRRVAPVSMAQA